MNQMTIYEILMERNKETNLLYKEWTVPIDFPIPGNFVKTAPPSDMLYAKFDFMKNIWVEDTEFLERSKVEELELKLVEANERVDTLENALLDLLLIEMREE